MRKEYIEIIPSVRLEWLFGMQIKRIGRSILRRHEVLLDNSVFDEILKFGGEEYLFKEAYSHSSVVDIEAIMPNTIYIYTFFNDKVVDSWERQKCASCRFRRECGSRTFMIVTGIDKDDVMFDRQGLLSVKMFCIKFKNEENMVFASYCPEYNIMTISDITYAVVTFNKFKRIILPRMLEVAGEYFDRNRGKVKVEKIDMNIFNKFKVTVGVDAELEIYDGSRYIKATNFYDYSGEIGCDGAGAQLELRPKAGEPEELVEEIKKLLERVDVGDYTVRCWSDRLPLGAHIHVGVAIKDEKDEWKFLDFIKFTDGLRRLLDIVVGKKFMSVNEKAYVVRLRRGYGALGDIRQAEAHSGFEYRTLPSYWIHEPKFAKITAEIVKKTIELYFRNIGKKLKIPEDWTVEDYVNILSMSREDVEYWLDKIENFDERVKYVDVRKFWGIKVNTKLFRYSVRFGDEWRYEVREFFERVLREEINRLNIDKMAGAYSIYVFGLAERRGDNKIYVNRSWIMNTVVDRKVLRDLFELEDDKELDIRMRERANIVVGIPYRLRTMVVHNEKDMYKLVFIAKAIAKAIWRMAHTNWSRKFRATNIRS